MQNVRRVAIIGGNRIPFARSNSRYASASNSDMLGAALDGLIARFGLAGQRVGEVVAGAVLKHAKDFNLTREVVLGSKLDPRTPAYDIQQACGTGLEAVILVANKIALGQLDVGIAGGVDTTSDAPLAVNEDMRRTLLKLNSARSLGERLRIAAKLRPAQPFRPEIPRNAEPRTGLSMGEHAAQTALRWNVDRQAQDELALRSHQRLAAAYEKGFFDDLMTPYLGLTRDQNLRPDTTLEKLGTLRPVFGAKGPDAERATMTAGNSSPLTDGASTVLLASEDWAREHNLPVLAWFSWSETGAVDFVHGEEGLLMAPAYACPGCSTGPGSPSRTSTTTRSTRRSPRRCWRPWRPGSHRSSARTGSAWTPRSAPSTPTSSTSTARRWPPVTRSPPPAAGSSPPWPNCWPRRAADVA